MKNARYCSGLLLIKGLLDAAVAQAQDMPKGFDLMAEVGQGFNHPRGGDALYLATLQLVPQVTVVPEHLRAGLVLGTFYPGTHVGGLAGGRLTLKVIQGPAFLLANSFHVNLQGEYLPAVWTGGDTWRQWVGGGIGVETSNLLGLAFRVHRDFKTPATYGQMVVSINFRYKRTLPPSDL
jgi:hypothetical protein